MSSAKNNARNNDRVVDLRNRRPSAPQKAQAPLPFQLQKRTSKVAARRKRTRLIGSALVVATLVSGTLIVGYTSYLPQYSVGSIQVEGAEEVSATLVGDYAESIIYNGSHNFLSRANMFLYPSTLIEKDIPLEFPRILSASVSRQSLLANAITINVVERQPYALWCGTDGTCYEMDQTGFIFAQAPNKETSTTERFVFSGGVATSSPPIGQTFAPGHTAGLIAFLQELGQSSVTPLGADVEGDQDFTVPLQQGFYLDASFGEDAGTLINDLQLVLSSSALAGQQQNLEYIDLRFGDRVYYKLKGQDEASTTAQ